MGDLEIEYKLSLYTVLTMLNKSEKSKVEIVQNIKNNKIYIKKTLSHYNIDVYKKMQELNIKSIAKIYEIFELKGKLIIIEEFINGSTLEEILEDEGKIENEKVILYMISLCDFLISIHSLNPPIIHRDIKPSNIIISNDNVLKVIDYDASRFYKFKENTDTILLGTQGYASPEQYGFTQTDERSDIYSMGVLMNVLTTGEHPNICKNNSGLKDVISKCTKILADHRYQSAKELKRDLIKKINRNNSSSRVFDNEIKDNIYLNKIWYKNIPGFRTEKVWKETIAILFYMFLISGIFVERDNIKNSLPGNIVVIILLLLIWLLCTNFLNIKSKIPIVNSESKIADIVGCFLYSIIILLIGGGILSIFE